MEIPLLNLKAKHVKLPNGYPGIIVEGVTYRIIRYNSQRYAYEVKKHKKVDELLEE